MQVRLGYRLSQGGVRYVRVDLRCRDAAVAEQPLNETNVYASFKQRGRGSVSEHVWRDAVGEPCFA